jgi:circadian clock protein KaiB
MIHGVQNDEPWRGATAQEERRWELRLYVAGQTRRSITAYSNLTRLCEEHIPGLYSIVVVDVLVHPEQAEEHDVIAIPTVVRLEPKPVRKILGDLSNTERALAGLAIRPL